LQDLAGRPSVDKYIEFGLAEQINEAWRDDKVGRIDGRGGRCARQRSDCRDSISSNADIAPKPRSAGSINNASIFDEDIETVGSSLSGAKPDHD
jgi:hypothetical protein